MQRLTSGNELVEKYLRANMKSGQSHSMTAKGEQ